MLQYEFNYSCFYKSIAMHISAKTSLQLILYTEPDVTKI